MTLRNGRRTGVEVEDVVEEDVGEGQAASVRTGMCMSWRSLTLGLPI